MRQVFSYFHVTCTGLMELSPYSYCNSFSLSHILRCLCQVKTKNKCPVFLSSQIKFTKYNFTLTRALHQIITGHMTTTTCTCNYGIYIPRLYTYLPNSTEIFKCGLCSFHFMKKRVELRQSQFHEHILLDATTIYNHL